MNVWNTLGIVHNSRDTGEGGGSARFFEKCHGVSRRGGGGRLKFSKQVHYFFRVLFLSLYILFSNAVFMCSGDHMNLKAFLKVIVLYKSFLSILVS